MSLVLATGPIKSQAISHGAGTHALVAAVAGKKIRVLGSSIVADGSGATVQFKSGDRELTGGCILGNNGKWDLNVHGAGWFETSAGVALTLYVESGSCAGVIRYQEIE